MYFLNIDFDGRYIVKTELKIFLKNVELTNGLYIYTRWGLDHHL